MRLPFPGAAPRGRGRPRLPATSRTTPSGAGRSPAPSPASSPTPTASASRCCSWGSLVRARASGGAGPGARPPSWRWSASAHGYAVLWAGLTATVLLARGARAPGGRSSGSWRSPALAFALAAPFLVPLLADWGWTTPYDDAWITVSTTGPLPAAPVALLRRRRCAAWWSRSGARRDGRPDARLLLLGYGALVGAALAAAGPAVGVIDVRFVPFAQLSLALAGAASLGHRLSRLARADLAALGLVLLAVVYADSQLAGAAPLGRLELLGARGQGAVAGLERAQRATPGHGRRSPGGGRVRAGPRAGRLDPDVRDAAVLLGPLDPRGGLQPGERDDPPGLLPGLGAVRLLAQPVPQPDATRASIPRPPSQRLPLFGVGQIVASSPELARRPRRSATTSCARPASRPTRSTVCATPAPATSSPWPSPRCGRRLEGWRDAAYRWIRRKPPNRAHLVFTDDPRFEVVQRRPLGAAAGGPAPRRGGGARARWRPSRSRIHTSRPGHPLLVKVSYHPRWRAEGADGPYLVSPGLMLVVPRRAGGAPCATRRGRGRRRSVSPSPALALGVGPRPAASSPAPGPGAPSRRAAPPAKPRRDPAPAGSAAAARRAPRRDPPRARRARVSGRRRTISTSGPRGPSPRSGGTRPPSTPARGAERLPAGDPRRAELLCVRGEALLRAGHPREALEAFTRGGGGAPDDPHRAQALYSGALAREAVGRRRGGRGVATLAAGGVPRTTPGPSASTAAIPSP